jgi:macrolide-specific efflux system membrane fusion protein
MKKLISKANQGKEWFRKASLTKKLIVLVIIMGVSGFVLSSVFGAVSNKPPYQTVTAQRGSIISSVSASGNVSASSQTDVTSPATGVIEAVYVKNGDTVTEGQNLFKVKATATPQNKASAYATYASALDSYNDVVQAKQAAQATLEKDRQAVLDAQNTVDYKNNNTTNPSTKQTYTDLEKASIDSTLTSARETFTADETKYKQADTAIAAANAQLQAATLSYQTTQDAIVTAPISGTVANLSVSQGGSIIASNNSNSNNSSNTTSGTNASETGSSDNASSGSTVLVLGNFSQLSVIAQINEADISKVAVGQNATVTFDALPEQTFAGQVMSVDSVGTASSGVVTYNAYINLVVPSSSIKAGMTASVAIQTARVDNVITVPSAAIQTMGDLSYVHVLKNGKVTTVPVTIGLTDGNNTAIKSGINEGDIVTIGTNGTAGSFNSGVIINGPAPAVIPPKGMPGHGG